MNCWKVKNTALAVVEVGAYEVTVCFISVE